MRRPAQRSFGDGGGRRWLIAGADEQQSDSLLKSGETMKTAASLDKCRGGRVGR